MLDDDSHDVQKIEECEESRELEMLESRSSTYLQQPWNILRYSLSARVSLAVRLRTAYCIQRCACCAAGLFAYGIVDRRGELGESMPRAIQLPGCPKEECRWVCSERRIGSSGPATICPLFVSFPMVVLAVRRDYMRGLRRFLWLSSISCTQCTDSR